MVPRYAGASLGLLAFFITITAGLWVRNPVEVILSRSILALFVFCFIGLLLGGAAQMVIAEYERGRESEILKRYREATEAQADSGGPSEAQGALTAASSEGEGQSTGA